MTSTTTAWCVAVAAMGAVSSLCSSAAVSAVRHETNVETGKQAQAEWPRIAVFGGSFSRIGQSAAAKDAWAKALHCKIDTYGVNGCGSSTASAGAGRSTTRRCGGA